jgi:murein DD-endopeptidase MepM/ murein hydrolase activator NlpD
MRSKLGGELMRAVSRFAIVGVVGGMTAACSTDRFAGGNPFTNPFSAGGSEPVRTGSISPEAPPPAMPRSTVEAQPLAPIRPVQTPPQSYSAPSAAAPSHAPSHPRTASGTAGWSTAGGTTVIVGPGETLTTLTSRYGVPAEAILSANGMKATDVAAGRRVVIPVYSATGEAAPARRAEAPVRYNTPAAPAAAPAPARVVASRKIEVTKQPPRTLAEAAPPKSQLRPGQKPAVVEKAPAKIAEKAPAPAPARGPVRVVEIKQAPQKVQAAAPAPAPKVAAKPEPKKAEVKVAKIEAKPAEKEIPLPAKKVVAKVEPKPAAIAPAPKEAPQKVAAAPKAAEPVKAPVKEPESTASISPAAPPPSSGGTADFRWPARGRVINGFGGGGGNEGINIAVPEGTPVKAAGDGVVAYAGSEVKGYGNLVLIRHDNGYVSAYANNGQIDVKRGQRVSRGQSIAKSGQTGNVTSPQLHFEIRKGSTPVDPMKYLASAE